MAPCRYDGGLALYYGIRLLYRNTRGVAKGDDVDDDSHADFVADGNGELM
eukprot:COSAG05_NODE_1127_length_5780_cov_307.437775_1_plen_50_part_00